MALKWINEKWGKEIRQQEHKSHWFLTIYCLGVNICKGQYLFYDKIIPIHLFIRQKNMFNGFDSLNDFHIVFTCIQDITIWG